MSEATVKGAANLKFVGGYFAKHKASFDVLGPSVADVGSGFADGHLFDEETAFSPNCLNIFFEAGSETESRVESLAVEYALKHCLEVLWGRPPLNKLWHTKSRSARGGPKKRTPKGSGGNSVVDLLKGGGLDSVLGDQHVGGPLVILLKHHELGGMPVTNCANVGGGHALDLAGATVAILGGDLGEGGGVGHCLEVMR